MKLSAPKVITWWISLILGALGVLAYMAVAPPLGAYAFLFVAAGLVLMVLATLLQDL